MEASSLKAVVGWLGMILIVAAWLPQTWETVRRRSCPLNLGFILLYAVGSLPLTAYAFLRSDPVFTALNGLALLQSLIHLSVKLGER